MVRATSNKLSRVAFLLSFLHILSLRLDVSLFIHEVIVLLFQEVSALSVANLFSHVYFHTQQLVHSLCYLHHLGFLVGLCLLGTVTR